MIANSSLFTCHSSLLDGVFYESDRPAKNALEKKWIDQTREKLGDPTDLALLQKTFDRMK